MGAGGGGGGGGGVVKQYGPKKSFLATHAFICKTKVCRATSLSFFSKIFPTGIPVLNW